jgi:hypothetical protein
MANIRSHPCQHVGALPAPPAGYRARGCRRPRCSPRRCSRFATGVALLEQAIEVRAAADTHPPAD